MSIFIRHATLPKLRWIAYHCAIGRSETEYVLVSVLMWRFYPYFINVLVLLTLNCQSCVIWSLLVARTKFFQLFLRSFTHFVRIFNKCESIYL